jgi:photosystem II stability/assembly factor-like uncharacterized protein
MIRLSGLISIALIGLVSIQGAAFEDPLDHSALQQFGLAERPLMGVALAGERLVAVGPRGLIIFSDNIGDSWSQASVPVQSDIVAVDFPSEAFGWAVGHDGVILRSIDRGETWDRQHDGRLAQEEFTQFYEMRYSAGDPAAAGMLDTLRLNYRNGPGLPYLGVLFTDEREGWVVGNFGQLTATMNGGESWDPMYHRADNEMSLHLNGIQRVGRHLFLPSEYGIVFRLSDQDERFRPLETGYSGTFFGVTGHDDVLVAYGLGGALYRSQDEGESWEAVESPTSSTISAAVERSEGSGFVFVTQAGELLLSDQRVENIRRIMSPGIVMPLTDVISLRDGKVAITGLHGVQVVMLPAGPDGS